MVSTISQEKAENIEKVKKIGGKNILEPEIQPGKKKTVMWFSFL